MTRLVVIDAKGDLPTYAAYAGKKKLIQVEAAEYLNKEQLEDFRRSPVNYVNAPTEEEYEPEPA